MSGFEIFILLSDKLSGSFMWLCTVFVVAMLVCVPVFLVNLNEGNEGEKIAFKTIKCFISFGFIATFFFILSATPKAEDLFRVRLALLKWELASPENVNKGVEEIQRIAKKLECKYIGGCTEDKKKK